MPRSRRPGSRTGTPEHRERISKGMRRHHAQRREMARVAPADLQMLRRSGTVPQTLKPLLTAAQVEALELVTALGGEDEVTPQKRQLIDDYARLGLVMRGELSRYVQGDHDAGGRVSTLAGQRRSTLMLLGLDRFERPVGLRDILAELEEGPA